MAAVLQHPHHPWLLAVGILRLVGALKDSFLDVGLTWPEKMSRLARRPNIMRFGSQIWKFRVETDIFKQVWSKEGSVDRTKTWVKVWIREMLKCCQRGICSRIKISQNFQHENVDLGLKFHMNDSKPQKWPSGTEESKKWPKNPTGNPKKIP